MYSASGLILNDRNSRLSVYFSGENLATITGYSGMDPDVVAGML